MLSYPGLALPIIRHTQSALRAIVLRAEWGVLIEVRIYNLLPRRILNPLQSHPQTRIHLSQTMSSELVLVRALDLHIVSYNYSHSIFTAHWCFRLYRFAYFVASLERGLSRSSVRNLKRFWLDLSLIVFLTRVVRSRKADLLKKVYSKHGDKVEIVVIEDLVNGDFTDALNGVSAVIHAATPSPAREELKAVLEVSRLPVGLLIPSLHSAFQITREGALNIVRQAVATGVKHISFIGTVGAVLNFTEPVIKAPLTDKDWNSLSENDALSSGNRFLVYTVAKTQAERALWKFAEEHPELNLTTGTFLGFA